MTTARTLLNTRVLLGNSFTTWVRSRVETEVSHPSAQRINAKYGFARSSSTLSTRGLLLLRTNLFISTGPGCKCHADENLPSAKHGTSRNTGTFVRSLVCSDTEQPFYCMQSFANNSVPLLFLKISSAQHEFHCFPQSLIKTLALRVPLRVIWRSTACGHIAW